LIGIKISKPKVCFLVGFPRRWNCKICGECCKKKGILFFDEEARRIKKLGYGKSIGLNFNKFRHVYLLPEVVTWWRVWTSEESVCPFLLEDNRCKIYSKRFYSCRAFPFNDIRIFYYSRFMWVSFNDRCPHYNEPDQEEVTIEKAKEYAQDGINLVARMYGFSPHVKIHPELIPALKFEDTVLPANPHRFKMLLKKYKIDTSECDEFTEISYEFPKSFP